MTSVTGRRSLTLSALLAAAWVAAQEPKPAPKDAPAPVRPKVEAPPKDAAKPASAKEAPKPSLEATELERIRKAWPLYPEAVKEAIRARYPGVDFTSRPPAELPAAGARKNYAILLGKIFTSAGAPIDNGVILVRDGKIEKVGPRADVTIPEGYETLDHSSRFAMPGMVDCHSHVGGSFDLNEMVYQTNPELRVLDQIVPNNDNLKVGVAGGVTTIAFIPGSGTNMGGWGAILKTGPGRLDDVLVRFPGCLKIAQAGNPERQAGELGSGHMGMNFVIREQLRAGQIYTREWDEFEAGRRPIKPTVNLRLEYFKPLFRRQIPVLVHTQGYSVIQNTLRILHDEMKLKVVIDHGEFDSYLLTPQIKERDIPTILGPRGFRYDRDQGKLIGMAQAYQERGQVAIGVNTDAPVVPQEELFFQATMAVRYGFTEDAALRGLTIVPAKALMLGERIGSIEPGKDADIIISTGSPIDPRNWIVMTMIDGRIAYDANRQRRRF